MIYGAAVVILIITRPKGIAGGKEFKDFFFVAPITRRLKEKFGKKPEAHAQTEHREKGGSKR